MKWIITVIRTAIGWHFLYEGIVKCVATNWTSADYLAGTRGMASWFYHFLAGSPVAVTVVDWMNIIGLIVIGLALFLGVFVRWASLGGVVLLALYYFAYPPFGVSLAMGVHNGSVFIFDQIFIEAAVLVFLFFSKEQGYGLRTANSGKGFKSCRNIPTNEPQVSRNAETLSRREALKNLVTLPVLGGLGLGAYHTAKKYGVDVMSGATIQVNRMALSELKGELPKGMLGPHEISRLTLGGNLIGGWSHGRDLLYTDQLFKAYNSEKKIFETLTLCEQAGVNCINIGYSTMPVMMKYRKLTGSKIKVIVQCGESKEDADMTPLVAKAIDNGMDVIQVQGGCCDFMVRTGHLDKIGAMVEQVRAAGLTAGIGAHTIDSFILLEEQGIVPDYYMKTMHHDNYWSAHPRENRKPFEVDGPESPDHNMYHNNCFCPFPDRTIEFVSKCKIPVMGFKVLAAGAIKPEDGFRWAFRNGADFICVGMFDFQVVKDVNICIDTLQKLTGRTRQWYA
ncbi:MAG: DoxX family protein [Tannerella sp.]|nr:DoxX family protein [Tannerella sp.]